MIFSGKKGSEASSDSVKVAIFPERIKRKPALSDKSGKTIDPIFLLYLRGKKCNMYHIIPPKQ